MNNFEISVALENITLLYDTREQPTKRLKRRLETCGFSHERRALNVGDYSCFVTLPDGQILDFSNKVAIERKMNIDELCLCFGQQRARFEREFERAKETGTKVYLLVENDNWERIYNGRYRSQMKPKALIASINAFRTRYNMQLDFCKEETTGKLIRDILYREVKVYLEEVMPNEKV